MIRNILNTICLMMIGALGISVVQSQNDLNWDIYLAKKAIRHIEFAPNGDTWIVIEDGGMMRLHNGEWKWYNGKNSPLTHAFRNFMITSDGTLYVGSTNGIFVFKNEQWTKLPWHPATDFSGLLITDLAIDSIGNFWVTTEGGLFKYTAGIWESFELSKTHIPIRHFTAIEVDTSGTVWIGTHGAGLYSYKDGKWNVYYTHNSPIQSIVISCLKAGRKGEIWIGTATGHLHKVLNDEWTLYTYYDSGISPPPNSALSLDHENTLWIASNSGYSYIDSADNIRSFNTTSSGLSNNVIFHVNRDRQGKIWLGAGNQLQTFSEGKYDTIQLNPFVLNQNFICRVAEKPDSTFWIASENYGIQHFNGTEWRTFNMSNSPLLSDTISDIAVDRDGNLWISFFYYGIQKYDGINWTHYNQLNSGIYTDRIHRIVPDRNGKLWFGSIHGLCSFDGQNWEAYFPPGLTIPLLIYDIATEAEGKIWIATKDHGLVCKEGNNWNYYHKDNSPLGTNHILSIFIDNSNVKWIGTYGLGLFTLTDTVFKHHSNFSSGINLNHVSSVAQDSTGVIWIGPRADAPIQKKDSSWIALNQFNSGLINTPRTNNMMVAQNGDIWLAQNASELARISKCNSIPKYNYVIPNLTQQYCPGDTVNLSVVTDANHILWNTKYEGNPLPVTTTGEYFATVYNGKSANSCYQNSFDTARIVFHPSPLNEKICAITMDSANNQIKIYWKRNSTARMGQFIVYKESPLESGIFHPIDTFTASNKIIWTDSMLINPKEPIRFYILGLDSCGLTSPLDFPEAIVESIYLQHEKKTAIHHKLSWNHPLGLDITDFFIYRSLDGGPFQCIDTLNSHNHFYHDTIYFSEGNIKYRIKALHTDTCDSIGSAIWSNTSNANYTSGEISYHPFNLFPNPTKDNLNIHAAQDLLIQKISLLDILGKEITLWMGRVPAKQIELNLKDFSSGIYTLQIQTGSGIYFEKIIVTPR